MVSRSASFASCLSLMLAVGADAQPPAATPYASQEEELTPAGQAAVDELRKTLAPDSEAMAMLDAILSGSRLGPGEGWFKTAVSQTRFRWDYVAARYDGNNDAVITPEEFGDAPDEFARVDRDGDGKLTEDDFRSETNSLSPTQGTYLFFMADSDANGRITAEEFANVFAALDTDAAGFLSLDDLRDGLTIPTGSGGPPRPDRPSRSTLILGLQRQEIGSLQPGPNVGDAAPLFTLTGLDGQTTHLADSIGKKPVVLIFGNFTCGPFRSQSGNLDKLYRRYRDKAEFLMIYVREAHPSDGWWMMSNQRVGINPAQPQSDEERRSVAQTCRRHLDIEIPLLVDTIDDRVGQTYSGMPNRLYLIDTEGKIAFKSGRGPFGFFPRELEQALILMCKELDR